MKQVSFSKVFGEIYKKHSRTLNMLKGKYIFKVICLIICLLLFARIIFFKIDKKLNVYVIMILITFVVVLIERSFKRYKLEFKDKAINILVKAQNETYEYNSKGGISPIEYDKSGFDRMWDKFYSEDYISGKILKDIEFKMSQIHTVEEKRVSDDSVIVTTFLGLYGIIKLPVHSIGEIEVIPNSILRDLTEYSVNMDSAKFEKYYDVLAEDRIWALQVFNSETLEIFIELREFFKKTIQVKIRDDEIYFRLDCGDLFEPPTFKNAVNFNLLYKYYRIIDIPRCLYEALIENIAYNSGNSEFFKSVKMAKLTDDEVKEVERKETEELKKTWFTTSQD